MEGPKRYKTDGFSALSGLLEHSAVLQDNGALDMPHGSVGSSPNEVHALLEDIHAKLGRVMELLGAGMPQYRPAQKHSYAPVDTNGGHPVDGVYDGQGNMVSDDGTLYRVPPAYAIKAGLREGDLMQVSNGSHGFNKFKKMRP